MTVVLLKLFVGKSDYFNHLVEVKNSMVNLVDVNHQVNREKQKFNKESKLFCKGYLDDHRQD